MKKQNYGRHSNTLTYIDMDLESEGRDFAVLFEKARAVTLTMAERRAGLIELSDYMRANPAEGTSSIGGAVMDHSGDSAKPLHISAFFLRYQSIILSGFIMLFIFIAGSLVSVAANALPGDFAYPVKTAINEPIALLLATTPQAKAQVETTQASEKLEEAEKLAVRGKLTPTTQAALRTSFDEHTASAMNLINSLSTSGNTFAATMVSSDFESALASHREILSHIPTANSTVAESVTGIGVDVTLALSHATAVRAYAESALATSTDPGLLRNVALRTENAVSAALTDAVSVVSSLGIDHADAAVQSSAEAQLSQAQSYQSEAASKLKEGAYSDAVVLFGKAHRAAQQSMLEVRTAREVNLVGSNNPGTANSTESSAL